MPPLLTRHVQLVWFVPDASIYRANELLTALIGLEAEFYQTNKVPSPSVPFLSSAKLSEENITFTLNVSPGRIDLQVNPAEQAARTGGEFPSFDPVTVFENVLARFSAESFDALSEVYRVASVAIFVEPCLDYSEAARKFFSYVGVEPLNGAVSDLSFQLNRPKEIFDSSISANHIVGLSVESYHQLEFTVGQQGAAGGAGLAARELLFLAKTIDLNTVPAAGTFFTGKAIVDLMQYFNKEAIRIGSTATLRDV